MMAIVDMKIQLYDTLLKTAGVQLLDYYHDSPYLLDCARDKQEQLRISGDNRVSGDHKWTLS